MASLIGTQIPNIGRSQELTATPNFGASNLGGGPSFDPRLLMGLLSAIGQAISQMSGGWNSLIGSNPQNSYDQPRQPLAPIAFSGSQIVPFGYENRRLGSNSGNAYGSASGVAASYTATAPSYAVEPNPAPAPVPQAAVAVAAPPPAAAGGVGAYG